MTVPDLGDDKKNRALEQLVVDFAAQLARYAECIFWLARYMERVENLARILDVT